MNAKTATFLRTWGWLIGALLILLLVLGNRSGCTRTVQTEEPQDLDLYESAYQDLNSAYKKQQRAERSRQKYLDATETFCSNQDSEALGSNSSSKDCNCQKCTAENEKLGDGNQIVTINIGDETSKKKTESTPTTPVKKSTTPTVKKTEKAVEKPCTTVINNYYGYDKKESQKTVQEAVQPKRSYDSSYEDYSSQRSETVTKSYGTTEEEDCWPTLKPSLVDKFGLHYKSDGRVYQRDGSLYKGKEQPFLGGVQSQDEASSSGSSRSSSYSSTTTSTSSSGGGLQLKPGYRRGPNGAVIDKNGNYVKEDPFIR